MVNEEVETQDLTEVSKIGAEIEDVPKYFEDLDGEGGKKAKPRTSLRSRNRGAESKVVPKAFEDLDGEGGGKKAKPSH